MKITNIHSLPEAIVNAVGKNYKPRDGRYSVTDLTSPPQIRHLKKVHWDSLSEDASDRLWALLGSAVHYILDKGSPQNALSEEKMTVEYNGVTLVGKADLYHNHEVSDWKITSVFSILLGDKPEWEKTLNLYRWFFEQKHFKVEKLTINAILRDWQKSKSLQDADYPKIPFMSVNVPLWPIEKVEALIVQGIADLQAETPRECTPEEKWQRETTYAVMEHGKKRALRVLDSMKDAQDYIANQSSLNASNSGKRLSITERPGSRTRCENYCPVKDHCEQYKAESEVV